MVIFYISFLARILLHKFRIKVKILIRLRTPQSHVAWTLRACNLCKWNCNPDNCKWWYLICPRKIVSTDLFHSAGDVVFGLISFQNTVTKFFSHDQDIFIMADSREQKLHFTKYFQPTWDWSKAKISIPAFSLYLKQLKFEIQVKCWIYQSPAWMQNAQGHQTAQDKLDTFIGYHVIAGGYVLAVRVWKPTLHDLKPLTLNTGHPGITLRTWHIHASDLPCTIYTNTTFTTFSFTQQYHRSRNFQCQSHISHYICSVGSGINSGNSNPCCC